MRIMKNIFRGKKDIKDGIEDNRKCWYYTR